MGEIVVQTDIDVPADDLFTYVSDHRNQLVWQAPNVEEVRVEPPGPSRVGTLVHKVRRTPMGRLSFTEEVTAFEAEGRAWTEVTISGGITGTRIDWEVLERGEGSTIRLRATMRGRGINRLLLPVIRRQATQGWKDEQAQLKQTLEEAAP